MADLERVHLLGRVAQMYYEQSATQEAIAAALNISRPTVSRLLKEAREEGVVQIIINSPFRYVSELETELLRSFATLRQARIIHTVEAGTVARAAAAYVGSIVRDGDVIGVSWGYTMEEVSAHLPHRTLRNAVVVQLNGGVARAGSGTNAHEVVARFGRAFGAETYFLNVPAVVDGPTVRKALLQNRETAGVLERARRATVAVFGIGYPESGSVLVQAGYITPQHLTGLLRRGAVGDILSRYFTADGQSPDPELDGRTIGLSLDRLGEVAHSVAVVSGVHKAAGALGALRGGFLNVLIADEATAREILRLQSDDPGYSD